jgi:diguanylate cyclase
MDRMDPSTLRTAAECLRKVVDHHAAWHENLLRAMFCDHPIRPGDLAPAAHRECEFGRWFYDAAPNGLRGHVEFSAMGREHQKLHHVAARLLRSVRLDGRIDRLDFEELVACNARFRVHVDSLRFGIEDALGNRDALTSAYGRVDMLPTLEDLRCGARNGGSPCSLVFMDVDHLKQVNDLQGHPVGDAALKGIVRLLDSQLRPQDKVFRYGGDEFLVALPGADLAIAHSVVGRVRDVLAERLLIAGSNGTMVRVTASFGIALLDPDVEPAESIARADQALLLAKTAGRNRCMAWDESVQTGTRWRMVDVDQAGD